MKRPAPAQRSPHGAGKDTARDNAAATTVPGASSTGTSKPGHPVGKARTTIYRGIRWRRDPGGKRSWYNEELERWQTWHPDADAPPLPPGWGLGSAEEAKDPASGGSVSKPVLGLRISRPRWRSPYRIVPIVLAVFVIAVALFQSLGNSRAGLIRAEKHAAEALLGQCLAQNGTSGGRPAYSTSTVSCGSSAAAVKVVKVIPGTPGSPNCPSGTTAMQIPYRGVRYPHVECVKPVRPGG